MAGDYSCFHNPMDLSLTGSQVSPPRKSKSSTPRSTTSSNVGFSLKRDQQEPSSARRSARDSYSKSRPSSSHTTYRYKSKEKSTPALAATFSVKQSKKLQNHGNNKTIEESQTSDDYLNSFFNQSSVKSLKNRNKPTPTSRSFHDDKSNYYLDTARSETSSIDGFTRNRKKKYDSGDDWKFISEISSRNFATGDASVNYLKSYLKNVDKYKDDADGDLLRGERSLLESTHSSTAQSPRLSAISLSKDNTLEDSNLMNVVEIDTAAEVALSKDVLEFKRKRSARKIQGWYRRHSLRKKTGEAAVKRMLSTKKEEMENNILRESLKSSHRSEEQKKKQREERAREARRQALKELQEKREAKRKDIRKIAEEEIELAKQKIDVDKRSTVSRNSKASKISSKPKKREKETDPHKADDEINNATVQDVVDESLKPTSSNIDERQVTTEIDGPTGGNETDKSRTTLDDLLETIKLLEEEPDHLKKPKSAIEEKLSWIDDLELEQQSTLSKVSERSRSKPDTNSLLTEAKLHSIIHYLDEVENTEPVVVKESSSTKQLIQAEQAATEVTSQMLKIKLDLEEKSRSVTLLQKALVGQRELSLRQSKDLEKELEQRLKLQKNQYEATIQRHLAFIDQLIDDKKVLNDKCEKLVIEMKQTDERYQSKIKRMTESHAIELSKAKDVLAAAEKLRRDKWIEDKTKKIKEMTVKGLEPEIQRLIAKHKEEMKKVKSIHEAELLRSDERAGQRYIRQTEELREQLEREKEAACAREREMSRQRYEKQMEQEEIALQQQRKRLFAEVAEEKERGSQQAARQRSELNHLKEQLEDNNRIAASALREEFEKSTEDASKRHKDEMKALEERLRVEKQAWQENYMKKQEAFMMQKERELKESVRRDRDNEIESAILRLEDDMHQQREELEKTTENRLKRIRDKYEAEMREVENSEKQTQEKYNAMKVEFNEIESENLSLQSRCKQGEQAVTDMEKIKNKLVEERGHVSDVIRQEFADRLVITEEDNKRMKTELSELRSRQRLELERINNEKEEELAEVHKRVRQAIVKKEETIAQIRQEYDAAVKRADHLESLLEAQRNKLLGKKK